MKHRAWIVIAFIALVGMCLWAATGGIPPAEAQSVVATPTPVQPTPAAQRAKIVTVQVTQFTWQLLSRATKSVVCTVTIEHDGTPNFIETINYCPAETLIAAINAVPTPYAGLTPQPTLPGIDETTLARYFTWKYKESFQVSRQVSIPIPSMIVNISAPQGTVTQPYVVIAAYEPAVGYKILGLRGTINSIVNFSCAADKCKLPISSDSTIELWALSSFGDESPHVKATVRVTRIDSGYRLTVTTELTQSPYQDACATMWGLPQPDSSSWASLPTLPQDLNTSQSLYILVGKMLAVGIVSAKDCPGDGVFANGSPNACGMAAARQAMIDWQNQFDPVIWQASNTMGVPARLLKTLIQVETQFWPGLGQNTLQEYGLGQLNYLGLDTALRWDPELFKQICNNTLYDCSLGYASLPPDEQAQLKGSLINLLDSACTNCAGGINLTIAQQSIPMLAQALRANCNETRYILSDQSLKPVDFDTMWHFTLVSYHSGYQCLYDAIHQTRNALEDITWDNVSSHLACKDAKTYVDNFWSTLISFTPMVSGEEANASLALPVMTTPTPFPSPTPHLSKATLHIVVYLDKNNDGKPEPGEMVDGLSALLTFSDGPDVTQPITNGDVVVDLSHHAVGAHLTVSIKDLFYFYETSIPVDGEVLLTIRLTQPVIPPGLP